MICNNCGTENKGLAKFCVKCGTGLSKSEGTLKTENDVTSTITGMDKPKEKAVMTEDEKRKKKIIGAWIAAGVAIVGIFMGVSKYKSENVSKKVIKEDFIGKTVSVGAMKIEVSKDNLKSIKLEEKVLEMELRAKFYNNEGTLVLEDKNYKVEVPFNVTYMYDVRTKNWVLGTNSISTYGDNVEVEIKEKASEDIVKKAFIGGEINGVKITEEVAKGLTIDSMEEDEYGTVINAYSTLENKGNFVTKKMSLKSKVSFDGQKWSTTNSQDKSSESELIITQPSGDITTEEIKKDLVTLVENKKFSGYQVYNYITVSLDDISNISDLKVDSITNTKGTAYIITANIDGKSNSLNFDGNIEINVSENGYVTCGAKFNNASVESPTEAEIKELVAGQKLQVWIDKNSKYHLITDADKENFKVNEIIDYKGDAFAKHVYANMTYTEQGKTINSDLIYMKMTYDTSNNKWSISRMVSSTDTSFARYYGKDAINK